MKYKLIKAIADFKRMRPELATPEGAYNQCQSASAAFADLLLARGIIHTRLPIIFLSYADWEVMEIEVVDGVSHYVFRVGRTLIDWTARQFDAKAEWPKIWKYKHE